MNRKTDTIIIGAGQAGLAISRCLTGLGIDHVVFERGEIGQRWRSERWESLHLLTPNWMTRLPGFGYAGDDRDGFMHKDAVARHLVGYSRSFTAPVQGGTEVLCVTCDAGRYTVVTRSEVWTARSVVIATGACDTPNRPVYAQCLSADIAQETPSSYKFPGQIAPGGVLVAGASATGVQLADELAKAGHAVTLAVGSHVRVPRSYRGRDLMHWLDRSGILQERRVASTPVDALVRQPSLQLVGGDDGRSIDLGTLQQQGVRIVGRVTGADGAEVQLAPTPTEAVDAAGVRQQRLFERIDQYINSIGLMAPAPNRVKPIQVQASPTRIDLRAEGIKTLVWATGYRRQYPWLNIPVLTPMGEIQQVGGVTPMQGLFTMGLPFMRRRNSTFLGGVGRDARDISHLIAQHLGARRQQVA